MIVQQAKFRTGVQLPNKTTVASTVSIANDCAIELTEHGVKLTGNPPGDGSREVVLVPFANVLELRGPMERPPASKKK